jgi:hypothetical protein
MTNRTHGDRRRVRLLPQSLNNDYRGPLVVVVVFAVLTALTLVRSLIHIVAFDGGAQSIATIPLDGFTANGAAAVVHVFSLWGLSQLIIGIVYVISLIRYRSLVPLLYLLAVLEYGVRLILTLAKPVDLAGRAPGGFGNYILVPLLIVLFVVSLLPKRTRVPRPSGSSSDTVSGSRVV